MDLTTFFAAFGLGLIALLFLLTFVLGLVFIKENQVGVVIKRFSVKGKRLPEGRITALEGEPGYQARTLGPGLHFWYFRIKYKVEKYPITVIPPGKIGLVIANDGDSPPVDRVLCTAVDCDNFRSSRCFSVRR